MIVKADLHTHSQASPDGGITTNQYAEIFEKKLLDVVAITDHNRIDFAQEMNKLYPKSIIVGEEIMTCEGEIIGLFLSKKIEAGLTPRATVDAIKRQGGIVYIPHPFETVRKGLSPAIVEELRNEIDIIEVCNGRAFFQNRGKQALVWAKQYAKPGAASSDAHGYKGLGSTYTILSAAPTRDTLIELVRNGTIMSSRPKLHSLLYPKLNRMRKSIGQAR